MKRMEKLLVTGIDDGFFPLNYKGKKGRTVLLSVTFSDYRIVDVDFELIYVDGNDATDVINRLKKGEVSLLDGVTFGGFNYIDPSLLNFNYIIFYSSPPNFQKVKDALSHFNDERNEVILSVISSLTRLTTRKGDVFVFSNLDMVKVREIIEKYQIFDKIPEPLKVAHEISSSLSRFLLKKNII